MRILLIEDEYHAVKYLSSLLRLELPSGEIVGQVDSVEEAILWIQSNPAPDLAFVDVQLADGLSFEIFNQIPVPFPVIFTTAYDEFTLEAFKVNSVDYLLKPVAKEELRRALDKFDRLYQTKNGTETNRLANLVKQMLKPDTFRQRFLLKNGKDYAVLHAPDIAFIFSEDSLTFAIDRQGKRYILDHTIENLEKEFDPTCFYRINRKMIVQVQAVRKIHGYFNHRLKLDLHPSTQIEAIVSRERVRGFKEWLDQ
ncbi:MAG: response regulator transcription factor [Saprospiraceae bacterium]|nr:response regulator transcription factor [Saprospiraceae bacterium]